MAMEMLKGGTLETFNQEKHRLGYEQIIDYKLEGAYDDPRWGSYIAELPKEGKTFHKP